MKIKILISLMLTSFLVCVARESHGGQRLLRKADFNVGSHINTMFRVRCKVWDPASRKRYSEAMEKRHITYFGEALWDGSFVWVLL